MLPRGVWFRAAKRGPSLHHGVGFAAPLLSFDYLFIFILLQNMTAYPLVATGQRKPGKSRDNLDSPVLYKQALTNISEGSSQFQNFKKTEVSFSLWGNMVSRSWNSGTMC